MRTTIIILIFFMLASLNVIGQKKKSYEIDFTNPESVVNAIFYAAKTKDFSILQCLCDPYGKGDGDTKKICSISQTAIQAEGYGDTKKGLDEFVEIFAGGKVSGQVTYEEYEGTEYANVPFLFNHPGGESRSDETMKLVKRHGNWYLSDF